MYLKRMNNPFPAFALCHDFGPFNECAGLACEGPYIGWRGDFTEVQQHRTAFFCATEGMREANSSTGMLIEAIWSFYHCLSNC